MAFSLFDMRTDEEIGANFQSVVDFVVETDTPYQLYFDDETQHPMPGQ